MSKKIKFYIVFQCLLLNLITGCSSTARQPEEYIPSGTKVNTTKEAVDCFSEGVSDLDNTVQLYIMSENMDANEITNAISRKISFAKKNYDLCNIKGCSMRTYHGDDYSEITIDIRYYMSSEEVKYVETEVKRISQILKADTKVDTCKNIYEWICSNVEYDYDTASGDAERFSAYDALKHKKAVCYGYAALFQKFCDELGIECMVLTSMDDTAHAWNTVKIKDQYYHVDTTFGAGNSDGTILWEYFLAGQDRIQYGNAYGITLAKKSYKIN